MNHHHSASEGSRRMCERLESTLVSRIPNLLRSESNQWCGFSQAGGSKFAYVNHRKKMHRIEIWCMGEPDELQSYTQLQVHKRQPTTGGFGKKYQARVFLDSPEYIEEVANMLFKVSFPLGKTSYKTKNIQPLVRETPKAYDFSKPEPTQKVKIKTYRILRDTNLARKLKYLHDNQCQLCGKFLEIKPGEKYSEAHHIKPLGKPHNGPDVANNIIILCPNHHVLCDYGGIKLELDQIRKHPQHAIDKSFIDYHNQTIYKA